MTTFVRFADVHVSEVDGEVFLTRKTDPEVYHLDAFGAGIWRVLAAPHGTDDLVAILSAAFPDRSDDAIRRDVDRLLSDLHAAGLIVPAERDR